MRRNPAVAGQFYQAGQARLYAQVAQYANNALPKKNASGILSPHAGLIYSGSVAGEVYSGLVMPDTFVLIGPNHTGLGVKFSIMPQGEWEIPTGIFQIDQKLSRKILTNATMVESDTQAHLFEHSLEVQLPFIAYFSKTVRIVPLTLMSATLEECRLLGEGIAKAIRDTAYPVVIAASSDMSHYVTEEEARKKDKMAIDKILARDPEGLYNTVKKENISMCGYLPATVMLFAVNELGAREASLVKYTTSGEVSGDYEQVVGYAGVIIS